MKLLDTISDILTSEGIFQVLQTKNQLIWLTTDNALNYDIDYYYDRSGFKTISPLYNNLLKLEENGKIDSSLDRLADIILIKFGDNWNKVYNAYVVENYNPLEDYNMERVEDYTFNHDETSTRDLTRNENGTASRDESFSDTSNRTDDTTISNKVTKDSSESGSNNTNGNNGVFGFNSSTSVPTDTSSSNGTTSITRSGSEDTNYSNEYTRNITDSGTRDIDDTTTNTRTDDENSTRKFDNSSNRKVTNKGKTSDSSYQKMLEDELKLREYLFIHKVYQDIDSVLVLGIYNVE